MPAAENKAIVQRFMTSFHKMRDTRDFTLLEEFMAPDVVLKLTGFPPEMQGRDAYVQGLLMFINAFPDLEITEIYPIVAQGNMVAARVCWSGTHTGELMGIPPTGKRVTVQDMHIERIENGKIVEHGGVTGMLSLLQQLGVVPAPESASQ